MWNCESEMIVLRFCKFQTNLQIQRHCFSTSTISVKQNSASMEQYATCKHTDANHHAYISWG